MSIEQQPTPALASVTIEAPAQVTLPQNTAVASAPPAQESKAAVDANGDPHWLAARLERERVQVLKSLGVDSVDDAKKAIADLKAKQDLEKSAEQRALEATQRIAAIEAEKASMASALGAHAKTQLSALSESQRAAVLSIAGDDAAKQLQAIAALATTWAAPSAAPAAAPAAAVVDTAPANSAPQQLITSPPDHKAVYAELKKSNPVVAARYAMAHGVFDQ